MKLPSGANMPIFVPSKIVTKLSNLSGWEQRGLTGCVAIITQPTIDALNPWIDSKTRNYSVAKTTTKALVGMTVGVTVRYLTEKISKILVENNILKIVKKNGISEITNKQFIKNLGIFFGVLACVFTNFIFDMPMTKAGINWCVKKFKLDKEPEKK